MIRITYNQKKYEVKIKGHANAAPEGEDLICAGVSHLSVALAWSLQDAKNQGLLEELICDIEKGDTHIKARPKEGAEPIVHTIFTTILNGYDYAGLSFPDYVSFKVIG